MTNTKTQLRIPIRRILVALLILLTLLIPLAGCAKRARAATITLQNLSGLEIHHVYLSPTRSNQWGPDQLGSYILEDGLELKVKAKCGTYDLRLGGPDGEFCEVRERYLCGKEVVEITEKDLLTCAALSGGLGSSDSAPYSGNSVSISNRSGYDIHELYLSSTSDRSWGPDQLGKDILRSGGMYTLTGTPCDTYDVRLVDEDGDVCEVRDTYLCGNEATVLTQNDLLNCQGYE